MRFKSHLRESLGNLLSSKLRSFLAILGVLVGTASVVALVSGGQLATEHALAQFKKLGTDLLAVTMQDMDRDQSKQINKDIEVHLLTGLLKNLPEVEASAPYAIDFSPVNYNGQQLRGNVVGVTESLLPILKLQLSQGRFISDMDANEHYCVLGSGLYQKLKNLGMFDVMGEQILVGEHYFTVIGVLTETAENMFFLVDINNALFIPASASLSMGQFVKLNNVVMRLPKDSEIDAIEDEITLRFQQVLPSKKLFFRSPQEIVNSMKQQNETFTLLLGFIGSIALLVGGIGVMNIMLVSVVERRREIGVRLAIGAKRNDIQLMFLTESVVLTLFGGFLGVLTGEAIAFITAMFSGWEFHLYLLPPLIGFCVSALVGIFFGFYPARKASRLDPIETLRAD